MQDAVRCSGLTWRPLNEPSFEMVYGIVWNQLRQEQRAQGNNGAYQKYGTVIKNP